MDFETFLIWVLLVAAIDAPVMRNDYHLFNAREHAQLDAIFAFYNLCWERGYRMSIGERWAN